MTNRQAQVGKFAPNRSEQPKFNPNWWRDLPKTHPLHDFAPTRKQVARDTKQLRSTMAAIKVGPNRFERRKAASIQRKAIRAAKKGKRS